MKYVLAQDIDIGDKLHNDFIVDHIEPVVLDDGDIGYHYFDECGNHCWNRHNEEVCVY